MVKKINMEGIHELFTGLAERKKKKRPSKEEIVT